MLPAVHTSRVPQVHPSFLKGLIVSLASTDNVNCTLLVAHFNTFPARRRRYLEAFIKYHAESTQFGSISTDKTRLARTAQLILKKC